MIVQNWWEVILTIIVSILVILLIWIVYVRFTTGVWPGWTGFGEYATAPNQTFQTFQRAKTLWDWMQLLIIPAILAVGAYLLNDSARQREEAVTNQRTQETALQTYFDKMTELLLDKKLRETEQYLFSWDFILENGTERLIEFLMKNYHIDWIKTARFKKIDNGKAIRASTEQNSLSLRLKDGITKVILEIDDGRVGEFIAKMKNGKLNIYSEQNLEVRAVARARTLTVLRRLDGDRKGALLRFLYEAKLIHKDKKVINLNKADLSGNGIKLVF